jgi:general secretion pathway protein G
MRSQTDSTLSIRGVSSGLILHASPKAQGATQTTRRRAFTLIEVLIVVVILTALATMVLPRFSGWGTEGKIGAARAVVEGSIPTALELYQLHNDTYPSTEQGLNALIEEPSSDPRPRNWRGPYLQRRPIDPWGNEYQYRQPASQNKIAGYDIWSMGPDGVDGTDDDIGNWEE